MNRESLSKIQTFILIGAALYVIMPDLFIGPIDDTVVAIIAGLSELALGYAKTQIPPTKDSEFEF